MKNIQLLIVDDSPEDRLIVRHLLGKSDLYNCDFYEAATAEGALELIEKQSFTIIFLDQNLPDMSGVELMERLSSLGINTPVVFLTGSKDPDVDLQAIKSGAIDYISKNGITTDILERTIRHSIEKHQMIEQIKEAKNAMEIFIAAFSHELKNCLHAIQGYTEILLEEWKNDTESHTYNMLKRMGRSVQFLENLFKNIQTTALLQRDHISLVLSDIDLVEEIGFCIELTKRIADSNGAEIALDTKLKELHMKGDRDKIDEVVINILTNAVKFSKGQKVVIALTQEEDFAVISVKDNGIGMSEEQIEKVFRPFSQANNQIRKEYGGTGLGLFIVNSLVKLHEGTIEVKSKLNVGTEVRIKLPIKPTQQGKHEIKEMEVSRHK